MNVYFMAVEKFDSSFGVKWEKFVNWATLFNLVEVVTLDCALCPSLFSDLVYEDWAFIEPNVVFHDMFNNIDWVLKRTNHITDRLILAVYHQPTEDCKLYFKDDRFRFCGYDLLDDDTRISALVNCGGFNKAFSSEDLTSSGLIADFQTAKEVQKSLKFHYPDEPHAYCSIWAMWKMVKF